MIHQGNGNVGQDVLDTTVTPFQLHAGGNNPFVGPNSSTNIQVNDVISTSDSIVTVPLYDGSPVTGASTVTVVGYLQLFINGVSTNGGMNATILNVIGCGSSPSGSPVLGSGAPIPVRLIHN